MNTNDNLDNKMIPNDEPQASNSQEVSNAPIQSEEMSEAKATNDELHTNPSTAENDTKEVDYSIDLDESSDEEDDSDIDENSDFSGMSADSALSIEDIVQRLRDLYNADKPDRKEEGELKKMYYQSLRNETETLKQAFINDGGEEFDFSFDEPQIFTEGKELLGLIREKRAKITAEENVVKEANAIKKAAITDKIQALVEAQNHEDFNKVYQEFKALQEQWKETTPVPPQQANELWQSYQRQVEKFYDLVRINNELREYDFKKNLELKTNLCEVAERLTTENDVVSAFHQLQNLHAQWREIGPVSRKDREMIWERFKAASTIINKNHQSHFDELKGKEEENLARKTALCERLEAIQFEKFSTIKEWNKAMQEVSSIQEEWRTIGYAPRKMNTEIYQRYRKVCDAFYKAKNEYFRAQKAERNANLEKKRLLVERAESLKESTDWKKTSQELIKLQKEWKAIGPVPNKFSESLWKQFIGACDYFFDKKKAENASQHSVELDNLKQKEEIIAKINNIDTSIDHSDAIELLHSLMGEWQKVGYVPFKHKDRIYTEYSAALDAQFERLNMNKAERKLDSFKSSVSEMASSGNGNTQLMRERDKLMRQYERMKVELQTYENNLGFFSVSSKKGNSLLDEMNNKINRIKSELDLIVKKIDAIDEQLNKFRVNLFNQ